MRQNENVGGLSQGVLLSLFHVHAKEDPTSSLVIMSTSLFSLPNHGCVSGQEPLKSKSFVGTPLTSRSFVKERAVGSAHRTGGPVTVCDRCSTDEE